MICDLIYLAKVFIMNEQTDTAIKANNMTAGEMLKNARTTGRRKREISTISKLLCIREEFLTALEECNYRIIPEDVYILGFARSYAVELGLNPDEVILKLKKELGIIKDKEEKKDEKKEEPEIKPVVPSVSKKHMNFDGSTVINWIKKAIQYAKKHWVWFAGGFVVLVVLIVAVVLLAGDKKLPVEPAPVVKETETVVMIKEPDFRYPIHEKFDVKNAKESRVVLQVEKESWVKIQDARGNSVFSRVLVPGDVYYMPLGDKYKATFGNVGAVDVWVDGQLLKKLGPANTKKTGISMAPDALKTVGFAE